MSNHCYTEQEAIADALQRRPDCQYAEAITGMSAAFRLTHVVLLWRTRECAEAGDPPRYELQGYLQAEFCCAR